MRSSQMWNGSSDLASVSLCTNLKCLIQWETQTGVLLLLNRGLLIYTRKSTQVHMSINPHLSTTHSHSFTHSYAPPCYFMKYQWVSVCKRGLEHFSFSDVNGHVTVQYIRTCRCNMYSTVRFVLPNFAWIFSTISHEADNFTFYKSNLFNLI